MPDWIMRFWSAWRAGPPRGTARWPSPATMVRTAPNRPVSLVAVGSGAFDRSRSRARARCFDPSGTYRRATPRAAVPAQIIVNTRRFARFALMSASASHVEGDDLLDPQSPDD